LTRVDSTGSTVRSSEVESQPTEGVSKRSTPDAIVVLRWLPLALALTVFLIWAAQDGGYAPVRWLPGTLFILGLAVAVAVAEAPPFAGRRDLAIAASLFAAYTAWSFLSISWADVKGDAWDGANRTLLYLCVFLLFAWRAVPARVAGVLLGLFAVATAAIGSTEFLRAVDATRPADFFISGRLSSPISYPNATAALFLAPFVPAVFFASRRSVPVVVRAVMLAAAGLLLELAIMCQSRASLVALPLVVLGFLAIGPGRLRVLLALAAVAVPAILVTRTLLDVYPAVADERAVHATLADARSALAWSGLALLVVGAAMALADRSVRLSASVTRVIGWAVVIAAVVAVVGGSLAFVDRYGNPVSRARSAWRQFKSEKSTATTNHLTSGFSSPRYDLWRVAIHEVKSAPIAGVGVENFAVDYLRLRRTKDEPINQHSLELRVLAQTGLVGAVLFGGFLAFALLAVGRTLRRHRGEVAGLAAAALAAFAYWSIHGSVDWFWEIPALGAPAIAWLALAGQTVSNEPRRRPLRLPLYGVVPLVLLATAAAAGLVFPWLAAKEIDRASAVWAVDSAAAYRSLDHARRLNPLSDRPDLIEGAIADRLHDPRRERAAFQRVLVRNPHNWYAAFELAIVEAQAGKKARALRWLNEARRLNPREPLLPFVRDKIVGGGRLSQAQIDHLFEARTVNLTGAQQR
jgi:hypothetical protein